MNYDSIIDNSRVLSQAVISLTGESQDKQTPVENSLLDIWANEALKDLSTTNCINRTVNLGSVFSTTSDLSIPFIALPANIYKVRNVFMKSGDSWTDLYPASNFTFREIIQRLGNTPEYYQLKAINEGGVDMRALMVYGATTGYTLFADVYLLHPARTYKGTDQSLLITPEYEDAVGDYIASKIYMMAGSATTEPMTAQKYMAASDRQYKIYLAKRKKLFTEMQYAGQNTFNIVRI